jgi:voltage-gated potassium channel
MPIYLIRISMKLFRQKKSVLFLFSLAFILISSTIAFLLEPSTFNSWFNAMYWVLTTMATVGYGDYYAHTVPGKVFTLFLYVFGIGLLSLIIGKIIESVADFNKRREAGKLKYHGKNHIIVISWSKKAQYAVEELLSTDPNLEIVVIDAAEKHPYDHPAIHFVSGDPTSTNVLELANINHARSAIIFADARIDDASLVDGKSMLVASTIESICPGVHTTVEIMLEKHIDSFKHVNVNEFILSHDAVSRLAARSAMNEGSSDIFTQLLSRQYGADIFKVDVRPEWKTYEDAFFALLKEGATLISDKGDMAINTKLKAAIPSDARLYVIGSPEAYHKHQSS